MIELLKNRDNYRFVVKSVSGKPLLNSVAFSNKANLKNTLNALMHGNSSLRGIERKTNTDGNFLFELKNEKGETIGTSGLYTSEAGMENGIKNFQDSLASSMKSTKL